ncbi:NAD-dependent epimerase/dehydratase family protein [bacterium]|nr:NAD-dependent epimerase/dehydratase family protein [bacterium]
MKRIVVSGGAGFVGQHLVRNLVQSGERPIVIVRPDSDTSALDALAENVDCWIYDGTYHSLQECFTKWDIGTVYHLATRFLADHQPDDIDDLIESNITFGVKLADVMTKNGVGKFINASTSWQYYHSEEYRPLNLYAALKRAFEDTLAYYSDAKNLRVANVILFDNYGENDQRPKLIPLLLSKKLGDTTVELSPGQQLMDIVHVDQVAGALLTASRRLDQGGEKFRRYIAASGRPQHLREVVKGFCELHGIQPDLNWGAKDYREREVFEIMIYERFENLLTS